MSEDYHGHLKEIPLPKASEQDSPILQQILDKLIASEKRNCLLDQRIQNMENRISEGDETLKIAEETIRATYHYLRESSVIIESQKRKIQESAEIQADNDKELKEMKAQLTEIQENSEENFRKISKKLKKIEKRQEENQLTLEKGQVQMKTDSVLEGLQKKVKVLSKILKGSDVVKEIQVKCIFCDDREHLSEACSVFRIKSQRSIKLNHKGICEKCLLSKNHVVCPQKDIVCKSCVKTNKVMQAYLSNHNPMLCNFKEQKDNRFAPY